MSLFSDNSTESPRGLSQRAAAAVSENTVRQFLTTCDFQSPHRADPTPSGSARTTDFTRGSPRVATAHRNSISAGCARTSVVRNPPRGTSRPWIML